MTDKTLTELTAASSVSGTDVILGRIGADTSDKKVPVSTVLDYVSANINYPVDSVNSMTGAIVLDADDIDDTSTTNKFVTSTDITKLGNLSGTNTGDQDLSTYQLKPSEGAFANGDKTKLDGIAAGAQVNPTTEEIQDLVGAMTTGNTETLITVTYQDTDGTIDFVVDNDLSHYSNATSGFLTSAPVASVNTQTGAVVLDADDISDAATTNKFVTAADITKLSNLSGTNTGDQTDITGNAGTVSTISGLIAASTNITITGSGTLVSPYSISASASGGAVDSVNGATGTVVLDADDIDDTSTTNKFTTAGDISKLAGIEAGADVTDTTNVTAAGALMDSEVDADIKTLSLPANTTITTFGASLVDDIDASTARTTLGLAIGTDVQAYSSVLANTTASFTTTDETKLDGIEAAADVTDATNVAAAGALMSDNTGVTGADEITNCMSLTTSEYTAIGSPGATVLYFITDAT